MSAVSDFYAALAADATVAALVGTDAEGAVKAYSPPVPRDVTMPYIGCARVQNVPDYDYSGRSGLYDTRVRVSVYADSPDEAQAIAEAVTAFVEAQGFGAMGSTYVEGIFVEDELDALVQRDDAGEEVDHWVPVDVLIQWNSTVAVP